MQTTVVSRFFDCDEEFNLISGLSLPSFRLAYETWGKLNSDASNAVLVFHALSGSHHASGYNDDLPEAGEFWVPEIYEGWWNNFIGPSKAIDTDKYFVICANYIGGCYGSTGPSTINASTGKPWGGSFPKLSCTDLVNSQVLLLDHLNIKKLKAVIGVSFGGLLAQNMSVRLPDKVEKVILIGTGPKVSILQTLLNYEQIRAIESDPAFCKGDYYSGERPNQGLALARMIAHKTYISLQTLSARARNAVIDQEIEYGHYHMRHPVESYMIHHGEKFTIRFDANTYLRIIEAWQQFDLCESVGEASLEGVFARAKDQEYLVFSIDSDVCFYPEEQRSLVKILKAKDIPCTYVTVHSDKGHDSFLLEPELFAPYVSFTLSS